MSKYKIGKFKGGYNYRGYCVYGKAKCWYTKDEDGNPIDCFLSLTAFKKWVDNCIKNGEGITYHKGSEFIKRGVANIRAFKS
jgi:hypothetical protein